MEDKFRNSFNFKTEFVSTDMFSDNISPIEN